MSAGQTSTFFQFSPSGSSKYETEIRGELVNGNEIKFHAVVTQTVRCSFLGSFNSLVG